MLSVDAHPTHDILASGGLERDKTVRVWVDDSFGNGVPAAAGASVAASDAAAAAVAEAPVAPEPAAPLS